MSVCLSVCVCLPTDSLQESFYYVGPRERNQALGLASRPTCRYVLGSLTGPVMLNIK